MVAAERVFPGLSIISFINIIILKFWNMSKYLASLVPEQIVNMVTRIKEATIDVGPQHVKFAKFIQVPWEAIRRIIPVP